MILFIFFILWALVLVGSSAYPAYKEIKMLISKD